MNSSRTWAIRVGFVATVALLVAAAYALAITRSWPCPAHGACDPPAPVHIHKRLALELAVSGGVVAVVTIILAAFWKPSPR